MKIINVHFAKYNQMDNLYFDVDINLSKMLKEENPIFSKEKVFDPNTPEEGKLWVKIYSCGIATFGFTKKQDPLHGNKPYTWSSNAPCVNREFELIGTPYELAAYGAGIREVGNEGCYWAGELTKALALKIAEEHQDKLHYGLEQFKHTVNTSKEDLEAYLHQLDMADDYSSKTV